MQNLSCENEFDLHEHKKSFSSIAWHLVSPWNGDLGQIGIGVLAMETKARAPKRKTRSENMTALHCFVTDACSRPETRNYLVFVDFSVRCCGLISQNVTNLPNWGRWTIAKSVFSFVGVGEGEYLILLHCFGPLRTGDGSYAPYKPSALLTARILGTYEACIHYYIRAQSAGYLRPVRIGSVDPDTRDEVSKKAIAFYWWHFWRHCCRFSVMYVEGVCKQSTSFPVLLVVCGFVDSRYPDCWHVSHFQIF